jgi:hypothetical protein
MAVAGGSVSDVGVTGAADADTGIGPPAAADVAALDALLPGDALLGLEIWPLMATALVIATTRSKTATPTDHPMRALRLRPEKGLRPLAVR